MEIEVMVKTVKYDSRAFIDAYVKFDKLAVQVLGFYALANLGLVRNPGNFNVISFTRKSHLQDDVGWFEFDEKKFKLLKKDKCITVILNFYSRQCEFEYIGWTKTESIQMNNILKLNSNPPEEIEQKVIQKIPKEIQSNPMPVTKRDPATLPSEIIDNLELIYNRVPPFFELPTALCKELMVARVNLLSQIRSKITSPDVNIRPRKTDTDFIEFSISNERIKTYARTIKEIIDRWDITFTPLAITELDNLSHWLVMTLCVSVAQNKEKSWFLDAEQNLLALKLKLYAFIPEKSDKKNWRNDKDYDKKRNYRKTIENVISERYIDVIKESFEKFETRKIASDPERYSDCINRIISDESLDASGNNYGTGCLPETVYGVPFRHMLSEVSNRRCCLEKGLAFVEPVTFMYRCIGTEIDRKNIFDNKKIRDTVKLSETNDIIKELIQCGAEIMETINDKTIEKIMAKKDMVLPDLEDLMNPSKAPLCMLHLYKKIRNTKEHRISYHERTLLFGFLNDVGYRHDRIDLGVKKICGTTDVERSYNFKRHYIGETKRDPSKLLSLPKPRLHWTVGCSTLQSRETNPDKEDGCPFKYMDDQVMIDTLKEYGLGTEKVLQILSERKGSQTQSCNTFKSCFKPHSKPHFSPVFY
jgi:hypothetical protein